MRTIAASLAVLVLTVWAGPDARALTAVGNQPADPAARPERPGDPSETRDRSLTRTSEGGHFRVSLRNLGQHPPPINKIHSWAVRVATPDGRPLDGVQIQFEGSMPDHGHGFPTQPELHPLGRDGTYRIDGVKFNMTGWWRFEFRIRAGGVADSVRFDVVLED